MQHTRVPILGFSAFSGTGKTTLLTQLIPLLKKRGLRIGLIKHAHHDFDVDVPGKDSFRLRQAGASPVLVVSDRRRAIMTEFATPQTPKLAEQLSYFDLSTLDLILVEGFKTEAFPKIELHRADMAKALRYPEDINIIAVASDSLLTLPEHVTLLDLNQPEQIANFIMHRFINTHD